ncbi:class I SAM-dependent methyltransferase [Polynucleobacter sp. AP-Titi-500A-B4]|uniref:class I SAM-dependent methyltransferase n=1 Tax=Polynucleobacter sp. AP-Titi-500A-B4 TaxID=2576923 RepID=UPI001BFE9383|nr:class I SAM-dependent methyltransferase [Polynucleobacter sp. AP-Titi-500A-B4]QWE12827.1 class I SAM-dependent methyltransferase [Polynucleobacter sp. AP-Titi-500A-B4]
MDVKNGLLKSIESLDAISNESWLLRLNDRKLEELEFHDAYRRRGAHSDPAIEGAGDTFEVLTGNKKYYSTVDLSTKYIQSWIREKSHNKIVLDYACGDGKNAILAAESGASLALGIDISRESVVNARSDASNKQLDNAFFVQSDAENTGLPSNTFDIIICSGMLHHLDLNIAFPELERILAPNGIIFCIEALDYNPIIKAYRLLTPKMRTKWEKSHILSLADIKFAKKMFYVKNIKYWHILSIAGVFFKPALPFLNFLDKVLTKVWGLQLLSWMFTFELHKK